MANPDLTQSIEQLARLKDEHRPILRQVAADPGMAPETRAALVEHLYEEEDEHVAEMVALAKGGAAPAAAAPKGRRSPHTTALSVGSLRPGADPEPTVVGSLRPEHPAPGRMIPGGTVSGALRPPPTPRAPGQTAPGQTVGSLRGT